MSRSFPFLLLAGALLVCAAHAEPPLVRTSPPGYTYEIHTAALSGQSTWLAGSVGPAMDAWGTPTLDAYLALLGKDGKVIWEKSFGTEGYAEAVKALLPLPGKGAYLSGNVSAVLAETWSGRPEAEWSRQAYLARVDQNGKLLASLDLAAQGTDPGSAEEPWLELSSLALLPSGELLAGGYLRGRLGSVTAKAGQTQAILLKVAPDLSSWQAYTLPGARVCLLEASSSGVLAAGLADLGEGSPPDGRCLVWEVSDPAAPREVWRGERKSNPTPLQLHDGVLLTTDNDSEATLQTNLITGQQERLPGGVLARGNWLGEPVATGYRSGDEGAELSELGRSLLWRKDKSWKPVLRWGTEQRDFVSYLLTEGEELTLVGTTEGNLPGTPPSEQTEQHWVWARMSALPSPSEAHVLGAREPGLTRRELAEDLDSLTLVERPGYDHLAGFFALGKGSLPAALLTCERSEWARLHPSAAPDEEARGNAPGFDFWSLERPAGDSTLELSWWGPGQPPAFPLEPQIFPHLSGSILICLDFKSLAPNSMLQAAHWFRLGSQGAILADRLLSGDGKSHLEGQAVVALPEDASLWFGLEREPDSGNRLFVARLDSEGRMAWNEPYDKWTSDTRSRWMSALALPEAGHAAALGLLNQDGLLARIGPDGRWLWGVKLGGYWGQTMGLAQGKLYVAATAAEDESAEGLTLLCFDLDGKKLWERQVETSGRLEPHAIVEMGDKVLLVGGVQDRPSVAWRGFWATLDPEGQGWNMRRLRTAAPTFLMDATVVDGALWVGGELTRDHVTDVFWGKLR